MDGADMTKLVRNSSSLCRVRPSARLSETNFEKLYSKVLVQVSADIQFVAKRDDTSLYTVESEKTSKGLYHLFSLLQIDLLK